MAFLPYGITSASSVVGNSSDGSLSTSGNVSLTSTLDGDAVVKQYTSLTVNTGHTLTVSNRCKGLHIYVRGDLVLNGTISMTARGANASNANQIVSPKITCYGIFSLLEINLLKRIYPELKHKDVLITASSVNGGQGKSLTSPDAYTSGNNGSNGTSLFQCGGGGSGSIRSYNNTLAQSGNGGNSTFFSGGSGSGAAWSYNSSAVTSNGSSTGGAGSNGISLNSNWGCGGGAGNPGGNGSLLATAGSTGTGGQLIIVVGGTLSGNGVFESKGSNGGTGTASFYMGGGGSGGGCILVLYKNSSFTGTLNANGGSGGNSNVGYHGGAGGNGYIHYSTFSGFFEQYG